MTCSWRIFSFHIDLKKRYSINSSSCTTQQVFCSLTVASSPASSCINDPTTMAISTNTYLLGADSLDNGKGNASDNNISTHNDTNRKNCTFLDASNVFNAALLCLTLCRYATWLMSRQWHYLHRFAMWVMLLTRHYHLTSRRYATWLMLRQWYYSLILHKCEILVMMLTRYHCSTVAWTIERWVFLSFVRMSMHVLNLK